MEPILAGVDNGNGNTKGDSGFVVRSGVKKLATPPPITTKTVCYRGQYYAIGAPKMDIQKSRLDKDDTLILTLATIAEKFKKLGVTSGEIRLAVGLPLTMMGAEKRKFHDYFMRQQKYSFLYEGVKYTVFIISVDVFAQGYSAVVDRLNTFGMTTVVVDIGSWTVDILPITEGQPDVSQCKSLSLGTFTAYADINESLRQRFGEEADEAILKDVAINGTSAIDVGYLDTIRDGLYTYVDNIMNSLKTLKFNSTLTEFVFIGGGASIIKNFSRELGSNMTIIEDVCINAKGYTRLLEHKYRTAF